MTSSGMGQRYIREARGQDLFDEADARRAVENLEFVAQLCERFLAGSGPS